MTQDDLNVKSAYALKTPEDSQKLYADWADSYDSGFVQEMDYTYPATVAQVFASQAKVGDKVVLDVGAGTGLVGVALAGLGSWELDGLDISSEMLAVALGKGCYRAVHQGDLTQKLTLNDASYDAVVSAGTITHGHVGPDAFDEMLRVARPGALFVTGIQSAFFAKAHFEQKFASLQADIRDFQIFERRIYGDRAQEDHKGDLAKVVVFRKR